MRRILTPGEQLIVTTRRQPRMLVLPAVAFVMVSGAAAFAAGWLSKGRLEAVLPWMPPATRAWLPYVPLALAAWVALGYCLRRLVAWRSVSYVLTSRRVMRRQRGLRREDREMPLTLVRDVDVRQGVLQGMLRSGTLTLASGHSTQLTLTDVPEVRRFRQFVLDAIEKLPTDDWVPGEGEEITDFTDESLPWELRDE
jgi:uncharacterized membrane protein YdbT with pleckstrin-like domain